MNYGYEPTSFDDELAEALIPIIRKYCGEKAYMLRSPYIEVNKMYPGVRIRKITNLTEDQLENLVAECDAIHALLTKKHATTNRMSLIDQPEQTADYYDTHDKPQE